ncbi:TetR/AcrR family transcriptional regulator C-terminal domain-containing protein [Kibdelosporangium persicum]
MSSTPGAPFHVGLTPDQVVSTAQRLTGEGHLFGWSIRDLARALAVAPAAIYHHVGGKDLLCRHVVERALADLTPPSPDLPWQDWFRELLYSVRPPLVRYPGTAKWLLMHGPVFPAVIPVIDAGIETLRRGGFGESTAFAYAALFNNALMTIAIGDERMEHEGDGPRDHAAMMREFRQVGADSPGVTLLTQSLISPFAQDAAGAERQREAYYRFVVDTTIAGLAQTIG